MTSQFIKILLISEQNYVITSTSYKQPNCDWFEWDIQKLLWQVKI